MTYQAKPLQNKLQKTYALLDFITEEQLYEVLDLFKFGHKMEASNLLAAYMFPKWQVQTLQAYAILTEVSNEW